MAQLSIKPSAKAIVTLAVILGLVIAAGGVLCAMQLKGLAELTDELETKKARIVDEKQISRQLSDALAALEGAKRNLEHLEEGVSEPDYVPTLLIQLDALAKSCGLTVEGVSVEENAPKTAPPPPKKGEKDAPEGSERGVASEQTGAEGSSLPYDEQTLSVEVNGGFERIVDFVQKLTAFRKIVSVDKMKVSPTRTRLAGGDPALGVTITLKTYVWRKSDQAKKVGKSG